VYLIKHLIVAVSCLALVSVAAIAQDDSEVMKTDWIELVKGYKGSSIGAEVRSVEEGDTEGTRKITLAIPKDAIDHPDEIEEVVVVGRKPDEPEPLLNIRLEWLDYYDDENYGLIIHLAEDSDFPIRLFMASEAGFIR
jgi:hypothetical protein